MNASSSLLRSTVLRRWIQCTQRQQLSALTSADPLVWTDHERSFYDKGWLDEQKLTQFDTLHEMQVRSCQVYREKPLFGTYSDKSQQFEWMNFGEYDANVNRCRALLQNIGVMENDKVGVISNNRWEWATIAAAAYSLNANLVPMYEAQLPSDWSYILNDSQACLVFCATKPIYDKVKEQVLPGVPLVRDVFCFNSSDAAESYEFATAMAKVEPDDDFKLVHAPTALDLASLIYTSGTTGKPKGVELTHLNFCSNIKSAARTMVDDPQTFIRPNDRSLAFLPWAHSYGQTCELWNGVSHGLSMGICRGISQIVDDLQLVKPTMLYAVPTLYKKIYDGVHNLIESASPLRKRLMQSALRIGNARAEAELKLRGPLGPMERVQFSILDQLVLSKIRARFGGNLRHGFVGGAACPAEVARFMDSIGIPVCEGYGLTETSPIISMNSPEYRQIGAVGRPIGGVHVYIIGEDGKEVPTGEEGEICCVGPNVMRGYYKNQAATDEVLTMAPDGEANMFHTGDLGRMDHTGFLKVTGRLKEQYKLENGKYISPTPIEEAISLSRYVAQVVIGGANRPYNVALIVPEWPTIRSELKIKDSVDDDTLASDERVKTLMDAEVQKACSFLKKFEIPQEWAFVAPFTAANEMLTPKMSIRRHKVIQTYDDIISHMYDDEKTVSPSADSKGAREKHSREDAAAA